MPKRVFISVGEVSGDNHAAGLVRSLRELDPALLIEGIGGPRMAAAGAQIHQETTRQAAMSFHAIKRIGEINRLATWLTVRYRSADKPDLHVCVDSSGFNLRFARLAREAGVPVLYYVAPQLWASREGRIKQVRAYVDRLASIFPFETEWYRARGVDATFVGHPLFDELPADRADRVPAIRYPDRSPVIGIVPGSRKSEVRENLPGLIEVMRAIAAQHPLAEFVMPTTPAGHGPVLQMLQEAGVALASESTGTASPAQAPRLQCVVEEDAFDTLIPRCDLVLCKSGTSTVHVAAYGVPMVVVYRVNTLLWKAAGQFLIKTPRIAMVNILAGNIDLVPEHIPWNGDPAPVAADALRLLGEPALLAEMRRNLLDLVRPLDQRGASRNVAQIALDMLAGRRG